MSSEIHFSFLKECIEEAKKAIIHNDIPIGCIITKNNIIIAKSHNMVELKNDSTMHAEIIAIRKAQKILGSRFLNECNIYISLEPCAMCAGAILLTRIKNIYFSASDPKFGAAGSLINILNDTKFNHRLNISRGILEYESSELLKNFFLKLRNK